MGNFPSFKELMNLDFDPKETVDRTMEIANDLKVKGVPYLQALVQAGDFVHGERIERLVKAKQMTRMKGLNMVGSYARFDWAKRNLRPSEIIKILPSLWRDSDPDDSVVNLPIWQKAYEKKGSMLFDEQALEAVGPIRVYRGQLSDELGISWSLKKSIAYKFAVSGGMRARIDGGKIVHGNVFLEDVLAYITGRGEFEVVVDPAKVKIVKEEFV